MPDIQFKREDGQVTLVMSEEDWEHLLWLVGVASGTALNRGDREVFRRCLEFTNRLCRGNDRFALYEIPDEPGKSSP